LGLSAALLEEGMLQQARGDSRRDELCLLHRNLGLQLFPVEPDGNFSSQLKLLLIWTQQLPLAEAMLCAT